MRLARSLVRSLVYESPNFASDPIAVSYSNDGKSWKRFSIAIDLEGEKDDKMQVCGDKRRSIRINFTVARFEHLLPKTYGFLPRDLFSIFAAGLAGVFRLLVLS